MHNFSDFVKILTEMTDFFTESADIERQKLKAAQKKRITFLEDYMKKEQVMILKVRGFDKLREDIQRDLGFEGLSLKQITERCSEEERKILIPLSENLNQQVKLFRDTCDSVKETLELNLHTVTAILNQNKIQASNAYSNENTVNPSSGSFTNHTI